METLVQLSERVKDLQIVKGRLYDAIRPRLQSPDLMTTMVMAQIDEMDAQIAALRKEMASVELFTGGAQ